MEESLDDFAVVATQNKNPDWSKLPLTGLRYQNMKKALDKFVDSLIELFGEDFERDN